MGIKKTFLFLLLILSPVAMMAKPGVSTSAAKKKVSKVGNGKSLGKELKKDIAAIKQTIKKDVLTKLDDLSTKAEGCEAIGCPGGWVKHDGLCYYIDDTPTSDWNDARSACQNMGGDLAVIRSADDDSFIFDLIKKQDTVTFWGAWLGLQRNADGNFVWVDGTPLEGNFKNFAGGEPNNYEGKENCVTMYGTGNYGKGRWNDLSCVYKGRLSKPVILCQKST